MAITSGKDHGIVSYNVTRKLPLSTPKNHLIVATGNERSAWIAYQLSEYRRAGREPRMGVGATKGCLKLIAATMKVEHRRLRFESGITVTCQKPQTAGSRLPAPLRQWQEASLYVAADDVHRYRAAWSMPPSLLKRGGGKGHAAPLLDEAAAKPAR